MEELCGECTKAGNWFFPDQSVPGLLSLLTKWVLWGVGVHTVLETLCQEEEFSFSPSHCLASVSSVLASGPGWDQSTSQEQFIWKGQCWSPRYWHVFWVGPVKFFTNQLSNEVGRSPYQGKRWFHQHVPKCPTQPEAKGGRTCWPWFESYFQHLPMTLGKETLGTSAKLGLEMLKACVSWLRCLELLIPSLSSLFFLLSPLLWVTPE